MFEVTYKKKALKGFKKMPSKVANQFVSAFDQLAEEDDTGLDIRPLAGRQAGYRLRIGGYRAIYTVDNGQLIILVLDAGPRGDIYK